MLRRSLATLLLLASTTASAAVQAL